MTLWCLFFNPHLTTHQSNVGPIKELNGTTPTYPKHHQVPDMDRIK